MRRPLQLDDFEARFRDDPDPWKTLSARPEAVKRRQIVHAAGSRFRMRGLELAAGNGSSSVCLARRTGRLDICEGTHHGVQLIPNITAACRNTRVFRLVLPAPFPAARYDLIVIAELLYYLGAQDIRCLAAEVSRTLAPSGRLVLAHHHRRFEDARQDGAMVHASLMACMHAPPQLSVRRRTGQWTIEGYDRLPRRAAPA